MGDVKKKKKKYSKPSHPWQKERIEEEKIIFKEYGLKNKKEIWRSASLLSKFKDMAKKIIASKTKQEEKEKVELLTRLISLGLLEKNTKIENVLSLTLKDILERRLQTVVLRKKISKTMSQSRQFIVHGHISIGEKKIRAPSYLVLKKEEDLVNFAQNSPLLSMEHPERLKK